MKRIVMVLLVMSLFSPLVSAAENEPDLTPLVKQVVERVGQLSGLAQQHDKQLYEAAVKVAQFDFILGELGKSPVLAKEIQAAQEAWKQKLDTMTRQAELIKQQDKKLQEQDRQIKELNQRLGALEKGKEEK